MSKQSKSTAPTKKYVVCRPSCGSAVVAATKPEDAFEKALNEWGVEAEEVFDPVLDEWNVFVCEVISTYEVLPKPKKPEPVYYIKEVK